MLYDRSQGACETGSEKGGLFFDEYRSAMTNFAFLNV